MLSQVDAVTGRSKRDFSGLIADRPDANVDTGSTFVELDPTTGKAIRFWYYDENNVNPINSKKWWQIGG